MPARTVDQLLADARALLPHRPSPAEARQRAAAGALLVDIRGAEQQHRDGHIPGALVIRRNVLEWRGDPASPWRDLRLHACQREIILICDEGYQSSLAAANLQLLGVTRATDMDGGFQAWRAQGLPVIHHGFIATMIATLIGWVR